MRSRALGLILVVLGCLGAGALLLRIDGSGSSVTTLRVIMFTDDRATVAPEVITWHGDHRGVVSSISITVPAGTKTYTAQRTFAGLPRSVAAIRDVLTGPGPTTPSPGTPPPGVPRSIILPDLAPGAGSFPAYARVRARLALFHWRSLPTGTFPPGFDLDPGTAGPSASLEIRTSAAGSETPGGHPTAILLGVGPRGSGAADLPPMRVLVLEDR